MLQRLKLYRMNDYNYGSEEDDGSVRVTVDLVPGMKTTTTTYPDGTTETATSDGDPIVRL